MNPTLIRSAPVDPRHRPEAIAERILPADLRRGRGAATNATGRFELQKREDFDDGWTRDEAPEPLGDRGHVGKAQGHHHPQPVA